MRLFLCSIALSFWLSPIVVAQDVAGTALASLTDPQKLATLTTERAANPRLLKCIYWLNDARTRGRQPGVVIMEAQAITGSIGKRAALVRAGLLRIWTMRRSF